MPIAPIPPATVPISRSGGRSRSAGFGWRGGAGGAEAMATTGGEGGRREGRNSGRSCVAASSLIGIAHSGLSMRGWPAARGSSGSPRSAVKLVGATSDLASDCSITAMATVATPPNVVRINRVVTMPARGTRLNEERSGQAQRVIGRIFRIACESLPCALAASHTFREVGATALRPRTRSGLCPESRAAKFPHATDLPSLWEYMRKAAKSL